MRNIGNLFLYSSLFYFANSHVTLRDLHSSASASPCFKETLMRDPVYTNLAFFVYSSEAFQALWRPRGKDSASTSLLTHTLISLYQFRSMYTEIKIKLVDPTWSFLKIGIFFIAFHSFRRLKTHKNCSDTQFVSFSRTLRQVWSHQFAADPSLQVPQFQSNPPATSREGHGVQICLNLLHSKKIIWLVLSIFSAFFTIITCWLWRFSHRLPA